ncbi:hypothetical protein QJQ45_004633 [Haematococcus lacustris]|nr:hypothetical protein QJQ45_004633 [Haematococcus lacustris]
MHSLQPNAVRVEASRRLAPRRHDVAMLSGVYTFAETLPAKHKPGERRDRGSMKKQVWPSQQMQRIPSFQRPALLPELLAAAALGRPAARNVMATVVEMCHMPEKHLQALAPLCGEEVLGAVRIAARLPRNNQGRRRQENLVAKMLRSGLNGPALTKLMDFVQESRATKNTYLDQGLQHLIDSWRQGLMQGDQAVLQEVLALSARVQSTSGSTGEAAAATHTLSSPNSQEEEAWVADNEGEEEGEEEEEGQRITDGLAASLVLYHHPDHKTGTEAGGDDERDGAGGAGSQLVVSNAAGPLAKLPEVPPSQPTGPLPPAQLHALLLQCQAAQQEVEQLRSAAAAVAAQAVAAVQLPPSRPSVVQSASAEYALGSSSSSARSRRRRGSTSPSSSRFQVQVHDDDEEEDLAVVLAAAAARARQRSSGADRFGVADHSPAGTGLPGLEQGRGSMAAGDEGVGEAAVLAHKLQDATRRSRQLMRALNARLKPLAARQPHSQQPQRPGPSTPQPAKHTKRTKAEPAAEPNKAKGKATKAKPSQAALNMQRIGESRWRPLELCWWPAQGKLPAKGKEYPGLGYKRLRDKPPTAQQQQQPAEAQNGWETKTQVGQVKHASGLRNSARDAERWLAPSKPPLQHLAAASSAGTSLEANLKHITVTLATWDAVWEVYMDPKRARQRLRL